MLRQTVRRLGFVSQREYECHRRERVRDSVIHAETRLALLTMKFQTSRSAALSANRDVNECQSREPDAEQFARAASRSSMRRARDGRRLQLTRSRKSNRH